MGWDVDLALSRMLLQRTRTRFVSFETPSWAPFGVPAAYLQQHINNLHAFVPARSLHTPPHEAFSQELVGYSVATYASDVPMLHLESAQHFFLLFSFPTFHTSSYLLGLMFAQDKDLGVSCSLHGV